MTTRLLGHILRHLVHFALALRIYVPPRAFTHRFYLQNRVLRSQPERLAARKACDTKLVTFSTRDQPTFDLRERYTHLGHVLHPDRKRVHKSSSPHVFATLGSCVILDIEGIVTGAANERRRPLLRPCLAPRLGRPARYMEKILAQFPRSKPQQLATNPRNIRYRTPPRYGSVYAPHTFR